MKDNTLLCGHEDRKCLFKYEGAYLYKCALCGLIFSDKYDSGFDLYDMYANYYKGGTGGRFNFIIERIVRLFRFFRAFRIFTVCPKAKEILDIGSGRGFMLYYLKKYYNYKRTAGTQISKNAFVFSHDVLGLEIYDKDLLELSFEDESFDIITMWHILEHIPRPDKYIERISRLLRKRGKLLIEVPNFTSWSRRFTGEHWLGLDLDYHIYFFTPGSLTMLLKKHNFKVKTIRTFSLEYSTFFSVQSLISKLTNTNHLFFNGIQAPLYKRLPGIHIFLFILLTPFCFLFNLLLYFSKRGEVLLILAEKN